MLRRIAPAIVLFFLAPLVAEFLLGNLPITLLPALIVLAPMYGGGALLVRESARRTGHGWPSLVLLGLAYAVLEEAFTTQTLFNPDYLKLGLHLLQPAYIPALGIGGWWTVYVLTLHTVWSVAVSIAVAEALVPHRETTAWLGRAGLTITILLFAIGIVATTGITLHTDRFVASAAQFAGAAVAIAILVAAAFRPRGRPAAGTPGSVPGPSIVGGAALAAASIFLLIPQRWGWWAVVAYLALDTVVIAAVLVWSRRASWDGRHRLALAGGAALAYAWHAFPQGPVVPVSRRVDLAGNAVFAAALIVLLAIAAKRVSASNG